MKNLEKNLLSSRTKSNPMTKVKIIAADPNKKTKGNIKCSICNLSYSCRDYKILYDVKKLVYLNFEINPKNTFCHECAMKVMEKMKLSDPELCFELTKDGESKILDIK